jgi:uridine kinase
MVNVVEKYIEIKKQLIILISGFSGSGKTLLAKNIEEDFKLEFINLNNYLIKDYNQVVDLGHDIKVVDWDNPDAIDWDKFNKKVLAVQDKGVVISGFGFPTDKIKFTPNFHIYLKISKDKLIKNRQEYLEEHKDDPLNEIKDTKTQLLILNNLSYKHYLDNKTKSNYTYQLDTSELTPDTTYDKIFDYIIESVEKYIYKKLK